jgi:hypothetical protein
MVGRHTFASQLALMQSAAVTHVSPATHLGQELPPQSTSLSVPFLMASAQVTPMHVPFLHESVVQSDATTQRWVSLQGGQAPPQSISVSVPFLTLSLHAAGWQTELMHDCEIQSALVLQAWFVRQAGHATPPQSTSVSLAFFTPSVHAAARQVWMSPASAGEPAPPDVVPPSAGPLEQMLVAQSLGSVHTVPGGHPMQGPPQSTSTSPAFFRPSMQLGG